MTAQNPANRSQTTVFKTILSLLLVVLLGFFLFSGCGGGSGSSGGGTGGGSNPSTAGIGTGDLSGGVGEAGGERTDRSRAMIGTPLAGAKLTARIDVNQDGVIAPLGETVTVGGTAYAETYSTLSDSSGTFSFTGLPITSDDDPLKLALTCQKEGYADNTRTLFLTQDGVVAVVMTASQEFTSDNVSDGFTLSMIEDRSGNYKLVKGKRALGRTKADTTVMQVEIPNGAFPTGVTGVRSFCTYLDPNLNAEVFPGNFLAENSDKKALKNNRADDDTVILQSVVLSEVTLTDQNNQAFDLTTKNSRKRAENWSTVTMLVPDASRPLLVDKDEQAEGIQVPIYYFDEESGLWKLLVDGSGNPLYGVLVDEEGQLIPQGTDIVNYSAGLLYAKAEVNHFSWWNIDYPMDTRTALCGKLTDQDGTPLANVMVRASGIADGGNSYNLNAYSYTDSKGVFFLNVRRSPGGAESYANWRYDWDLKTASVPQVNTGGDQRVNITALIGWNEIACGNSSLSEPNAGGQVNWQNIGTPTLITAAPGTAESPARYLGTCQIDLSRKISGRIVKENGGDPVAGIAVVSTFGRTVTTGTDGRFSFTVLPGVDLSVYAYGIFYREVASGADDLDLGDIVIPNHPPVITSLSADPNNPNLNTGVNLTGSAYDLDGDTLTYTWTLAEDEAWSAQGAKAAWNGSSESGVYHFKLTVSDGLAETSALVPVFTADMNLGDNLRVIVLENDQPVQGAKVVLQGLDNLAVEQTKTTDEDGVADFGDVGRSRGTFTVAMSPNQDVPSTRVNGELNNDEVVMATFRQVLFADPLIIRMEQFEGRGYTGSAPGVSFDLKLSGLPDSYYDVSYQPNMYYNYANWGYDEDNPYFLFTGLYPYSSNLQNDGKLSLLGMAWGYEAQPKNKRYANIAGMNYGFLTDLLPHDLDQTTQEIALSNQATMINWISNRPVNWMRILGIRKGQAYDLSPFDLYGDYSMFYDYGNLWVADQFPADQYRCEAAITGSQEDGGNFGKIYQARLGGIPAQLEAVIPDVDVSALTNTDSAFGWTLSGTDKGRLNLMYLTLSGGDLGGWAARKAGKRVSRARVGVQTAAVVKWTVIGQPGDGATLPTQPEEVAQFLPESWIYAELYGLLLEPAPGATQSAQFDNIWINFLKGMNPEEDSDSMFRIHYSKYLQNIVIYESDRSDLPPAQATGTRKAK